MSTPISKEALVRLSWLVELRRQGHRQCRWADGPLGAVCALSLLEEMTPRPPDGYEDGLIGVAKLAGLSTKQALAVFTMNDGRRYAPDAGQRFMAHCRKHTFSEIADVVEGWFPS